MANDDHVSLLRSGTQAWNNWRESNPEIKPDLSGANFTDVFLTKADLRYVNARCANFDGAQLSFTDFSGSDLTGASFKQADMSVVKFIDATIEEVDFSHANLNKAYLDGAIARRSDFSKARLTQARSKRVNFVESKFYYSDLSKSDFEDANFWGSIMKDAILRDVSFANSKLCEVDFSNAVLFGVNFFNANLTQCNIAHANLCQANLASANLTGIIWNRKKMRGHYLGIRGLDSAYGNALFRRDALDQDFLDTLEYFWMKSWKRKLFLAWGLLDFGRSMSRVAVFAFGVVIIYGSIYEKFRGILSYQDSADTWFSPFYFSIVTFTTLGFGDVRPRSVIGEMLSSSEVVIGYITLGLLLAVLAEKLARRS